MLDAQLSCHLGLRVQGRNKVAGQMQATFSPATALCFRLPVLLSAWCWCQETGKLATNCSATPGHWKSLGGVQWADGLVQNSKVLVFVQPHGRVTATILYLWSTLSSLRQPLYPPPHSLSPIIFFFRIFLSSKWSWMLFVPGVCHSVYVCWCQNLVLFCD